MIDESPLVTCRCEHFARIVKYIHRDNPDAAERIARNIHESADALKLFPNRGRLGRIEGTRELPLPPLPFILVYRVKADVVEIVNVVHRAQKWPSQD